jgi:hypothetical protein
MTYAVNPAGYPGRDALPRDPGRHVKESLNNGSGGAPKSDSGSRKGVLKRARPDRAGARPYRARAVP